MKSNEQKIKELSDELESLRESYTLLCETNHGLLQQIKDMHNTCESLSNLMKSGERRGIAKREEEITELRKQIDIERARKEESYKREEHLIQENKELRRSRLKSFNNEEYIIFFDDGEDYPDSMVAPVVMSAEKFRELYYAREELNKEHHND